jgi:uncharacterized membrane protein
MGQVSSKHFGFPANFYSTNFFAFIIIIVVVFVIVIVIVIRELIQYAKLAKVLRAIGLTPPQEIH